MYDKLIFELSSPGREAVSLADCDVPIKEVSKIIPAEHMRENPPELPEVSEVDIVRHYTRLSQLNYSVDTGFYPLGSCTMKYNPKINEDLARLPGFSRIHPLQPESTVQGAMQVMHELGEFLGEIAGVDAVTLQPAAGAHGELTGILMIRAYHKDRGSKRTKVLIPDSGHGTNPASAAIAGFKVLQLKSNLAGEIDLNELERMIDEETAALMLTVPNTLGIFESQILTIEKIVHSRGALMYLDGANLNALLGIARPGDMGFDVVHFNLHKSFSTPHGSGGPGSGPVGVRKDLVPFLPSPVIEKGSNGYYFDFNRPKSIGKIHGFYGNFGVMVKAYAYIMSLGSKGLRDVSENSIINANYLRKILQEYYDLPYKRICMHEFVLSGKRQKKKGVSTLDIAKRLLDYGMHAPTIYFPLIVEEALMIEPTETESRETLDAFGRAMINIAHEVDESPDLVKNSPSLTPIGRLDKTMAARQPNLRWRKG